MKNRIISGFLVTVNDAGRVESVAKYAGFLKWEGATVWKKTLDGWEPWRDMTPGTLRRALKKGTAQIF